MRIKFYIVLILLSCAAFAAAQDSRFLNRVQKENQVPAVKNVFKEIEQAISEGNVAKVSSFFSSQTYFSLSSGSSGYYSSNQAFYILENFFKVYQVKSFRFNNIQTGDSDPYGTGVYTYELKGKRNTAQVYLSLKQSGSTWKITQLTIN